MSGASSIAVARKPSRRAFTVAACSPRPTTRICRCPFSTSARATSALAAALSADTVSNTSSASTRSIITPVMPYCLHQPAGRPVLVAHRRQHDARHPPVMHAVEDVALARFGLPARRGDQRIAALLGQPFELRHHRAEELALEFGNDRADDPPLGAAQIRGERVDAIAEQSHRVEHALRIFGAHGGDALHDLGNRGGGHAGAACHVVDRRAPLLGSPLRHHAPPVARALSGALPTMDKSIFRSCKSFNPL